MLKDECTRHAPRLHALRLTCFACRAGALGSAERAAEFANRAWEAYGAALQSPRELGSCSERSTVRYNAACAAARCGAAADALRLLEFVAAKEPAALDGAEADDDLEPLRGMPEFQAVMQSAMHGVHA